MRDAFPPPICCVDCLRISFGWIMCGRLMAFGWIACKWLFGLCGIAWKNITEIGRGGACVPARVALQGSIRRYPCTQCVYFWHGNAAARPCRLAGAHPSLNPPRTMRMFLAWKRRCADVRAGTQAPPLRFRLGGLHMGDWFRLGRLLVGPVSFVWVDYTWDG